MTTTCEPRFTKIVFRALTGMGYQVKVNDPYKGVELVRAYSDPRAGRHSLQIEINKRLYMDEARCLPTAGFPALQKHLATLVEAVRDYVRTPRAPRANPLSATREPPDHHVRTA